jgi:ectoine hydroxylase-related dioxygenase (phytanoyl-CoA dioxygenase family)
VQIIPGSHKFGLLNPEHTSGFLSAENIEKYAPNSAVEYLEMEEGEAVLLHNWLLHRSDTNSTDIPRRAFSVCYMDARTSTASGEQFPTIFGQDALTPEALELAASR